MPIKSRAEINANIVVKFPDNNNKEIVAERLRNQLTDINDSSISKKGDNSIQNTLSYLSTVVITSDYELITKKYFSENIPVITSLFAQGGNSFTATARLGTIDNQDLVFKTHDIDRGIVDKSGYWGFGTITKFTDTFVSIQSVGNNSTTIAQQWKNSDGDYIAKLKDSGELDIRSISTSGGVVVIGAYDNTDTALWELFANASVKTPGGFLDASDLTALNPYARNLYLVDGTTPAYQWASGVFKKTDTSNVANMLFQYLCTGGTVDLYWSAHSLENDWKCTGSFTLFDNTDAYYIGDSSTNGSWRRRIDGTDIVDERRESGVWIEKSRILA